MAIRAPRHGCTLEVVVDGLPCRRISRRSWRSSLETGPDRVVHGVVRWRRIDLQRLIAERFGVVYHERTVGKILKQLGFSHISAPRPCSST